MKATTLLKEHMRRDATDRGALSRGLRLLGVKFLANQVGPRGIREVLRPFVPVKGLSKQMVIINKAQKEIEALSCNSAVVMQELRQVIHEQVMGGESCEEV